MTGLSAKLGEYLTCVESRILPGNAGSYDLYMLRVEALFPSCLLDLLRAGASPDGSDLFAILEQPSSPLAARGTVYPQDGLLVHG